MSAFEDLPGRTLLDSSVLQALMDYGAHVWENEPIPFSDKVQRHPHLLRNIEALRLIFRINERANWEFALSVNSLDEVQQKGDARYLRWAYDVLDHWQACVDPGEQPAEHLALVAERLDGPRVGYLGAGDRKLLKDAIRLGCDTFLTMEARLPRNGSHIRTLTGLTVLTPEQFWIKLEPWAGLWC